MDLARLTQCLRDSPFSAHSDYLVAHARPCIDIEITGAAIQTRRSRFGGSPDLPRGMPWPESPHGPYRFIAQIDCGELPAIGAALPTKGLLSLFVGIDSDDGKFFWRSPGYVKAFVFAPDNALTTVAPPESVSFGGARAVRFHSGVDLPFDQYQVDAWPLGTDYDRMEDYGRLRDSLHVSPHYLLGYPSHCSLGYDPTPGQGWKSLITLGSDGDLWWEWHDGDKLMVFIEADRLAKHDFTKLASDAG